MLDRQHDIAVRRIKPDFAVSHGREGAVFYVGSKSKSGFITGA
jgi:hypothetical protein